MKKILKALFVTFGLCSAMSSYAQETSWSSYSKAGTIATDKAVSRSSFPKEYKLFTLNIDPLSQQLQRAVSTTSRHSAIVSLPNADGGMEEFEVYEASNF